MNNNICLFACLLFIAFSCVGQPSGVLSVEEFYKKSEKKDSNTVIVDLRTSDEIKDGRIPGAIHLDFHAPDFNENLEELNREKTYLIYCKAGGRSGRTFNLMQEYGFQNVYDLKGGMNAWISKGMEVETPD